MNQAVALATLFPRREQRTPAQLAGLPRLDAVAVKDLADAAGVAAKTIWKRCRLWETDPKNPRALPYVRTLGRPYKIRRLDAVKFLEAVA